MLNYLIIHQYINITVIDVLYFIKQKINLINIILYFNIFKSSLIFLILK
jgi:hypothetical protein